MGPHDPVQNGREAGPGWQVPQTLLKRAVYGACREGFMPPASRSQAACPVQNGDRQNLFWTRVKSILSGSSLPSSYRMRTPCARLFLACYPQ